jgi:hypothetical protein
MGKNRTGPVVVCEKCGTRFRAWRPDRPNRFCSTKCAPHGRPAKTPSTKCEYCGVLFRRFGGGHAARFCSRDCYRKSGTKYIDKNGYVLIYAFGEPGAYKNGQIKEHRLVMQRHLGRQLERWETIHHIDGDRSNNEIENLQLRTGQHGKGITLRCRDCGSCDIETVPM